jgi:hypothetical protein
MPAKSVVNKCIWCLEAPSSTTFNSESHVLPECLGNEYQQVLPKGIVCDKCNNYFGTKLEPKLIDEPILDTIVGILELRDIDSQFTYNRSPSGIRRQVHMTTVISANKFTLTTQYEIDGQPDHLKETRIITRSKDYDKKALAWLSRAVHKIAFETVAHNEFVGTGIQYKNKTLGCLDVFHHRFNIIRDWVRYGKPQNMVRPVLRIQRFDEVERKEQFVQWGGWTHHFRHGIYCKLNLFNDWYFINLTSSPDAVESDLVSWVQKQKVHNPVWMVGNKLQRSHMHC